jgi:Phage Tail Collar Domain.
MGKLFSPAEMAVIKQQVGTGEDGANIDTSALLIAEQAFSQTVSNKKDAKTLQQSIDEAARRLNEAVNSIEENIMPFRVPVGSISMFLRVGDKTPTGWLELNGQHFDPEMYPQLAEYLDGGTQLPDMRGYAPRGYGYMTKRMRFDGSTVSWVDAGLRGLGSVEQDSMRSHTHGLGRNIHEFDGQFENHGPGGYVVEEGGETAGASQQLVTGFGKFINPPNPAGENSFDDHHLPWGGDPNIVDPDHPSYAWETRMRNIAVAFMIFAGIPELLTKEVPVPEDPNLIIPEIPDMHPEDSELPETPDVPGNP